MTVSRKEFFQQGVFSLGGALLQVAGLCSAPLAAVADETANGPQAGEPRLAQAVNEYCLARNCGCFACVERCELQAITVVMGEGIRVDEQLCTGCGSCEYVCPVSPKAIRFVPRHAEH